MALASGTRLGRYEIRGKIGQGGMGEVYRAHDLKLARDVALKMLPDVFAKDGERVSRFEREARLLASLHHSHIAAIHGLEESDSKQFLVLEYVSGVTLAERIMTGPISLEPALDFAAQIAEALEAAHEKAIIHRDLKPGNIMITDEDQVKILDFGLAKALQDETPETNFSESPTIIHTGTKHGVILGTAAYMSPEQAKGKRVDKRTDIWAFGCVVYEMLAGQPPFSGETMTDTLAAVIRAEPDWSALPAETPNRICELLRRCLQKDSSMRLRDIGDARIEISAAMNQPGESSNMVTLPAHRARSGFMLPAIVGLIAGVLITALAFWTLRGFLFRSGPLTQPTHRFAITLPDSEPLALTKFVPLAIGRKAVAISPDGTKIVYAANHNGMAELKLQLLDEFESKPISGTEGAYNPFFSPDGQWVAFFAENKLKKVSLAGGQPVVLCEARNPVGATWGANGAIYYGNQEGGILTEIASAGGAPKTTPVEATPINELEILPDGNWLLCSDHLSSNPDYGRILAVSAEGGQPTVILEGGSNPHYLNSGHLLFTRGASLMIAPFDVMTRKVTGPAVAVVEGIRSEIYGNAQYAVSNNGVLVYIPGPAGWIGKPVWVDRQGNVTPIGLPAQCYGGSFTLSPDGKRIAIAVSAATDDIWIYEFERGTFLRLTVEGNNFAPVWSPDGKRIVFASLVNGRTRIVSKPADANGPGEQLLDCPAASFCIPESWSTDGKALSVTIATPTDAGSILILPLEGDRKLQPFLDTPFSEFFSSFSPDNRWIVYTSDESGRYEVYVRPYPGPGGKWQISTEGGEEPLWSANGEEIFYRNGEKWMVATVNTKGDFSAQTPRLLFERYFINVPGFSHYLSPDGRRQVMIQPVDQSVPKQINVVLNWFEDLKQRVP